MSSEWLPQETNTHQDHVIAHVRGATALGYFIHDEVTYFLLDIGFIWSIFLDGEMGLVPQSMAINELEIGDERKAELLADVRRLHAEGADAENLMRLTPVPLECFIEDVLMYTLGEDRRRIIIKCEEASIALETSLATGEVKVDVSTMVN